MSARRYKPYPAYKDSGVEWLGEIPAHWSVKRLKDLVTLNVETLPEDTDPTFEMSYVDIGGVDGLGRVIEREPLTFGSAPSRARRLVRDGDVIVSTVRTYLRAIAQIREPEPHTVVSTGFAVVRPGEEFKTDYAAYALRAPYFVERVVANSKGVSFPAITDSEMATYELALPPDHEQCSIAAFLNTETARVDALIAKKERLIELLHEKRSALITRTVTKGLDTDVTMKESGVEWLGEIPEHWENLSLARVTLSRCDGPFGSGLKSEHYSASGVRVIRLQNIGWTEFLDEDQVYLDEAYARQLGDHRVQAGDLLIAGLGDERNPVGRACVAPGGIEPAMVKADCFRFRLERRKVLPRFLAFQLSATASAAAGSLASGATRARMNLTTTASRKVAFPSVKEQQVIVNALDREGMKHHALVAKVRVAIESLRELRKTLISAAVTGKIDVRECATTQEPAA